MDPNLFELIRQWGEERNLLDPERMHAQVTKLFEEGGEVAGAVARRDRDKLADGIGDVVVVLTLLAGQAEMQIEDCIASAYATIKDRRGKTVDGVFVKEGD